MREVSTRESRSPGSSPGLLCFSEQASALDVRRDRRRVHELLGLVVDVDRDLAELVAVLTGVVGAEEELAARGKLHAKIGLSAAPVATVAGGQCAGGNGCGHVCLPFLWVRW
jgi:hypothetical protein